MGDDLRYSLRNLGDVLFDKISAASQKMKGSTHGISLTYTIGELQKEKEKLIKRVGKRVVGIRKSKADSDFSNDEKLNMFFSKLDNIQQQIDEAIAERKGRLYPK
ncbi:MAG: hypothetical protein HQK68_08075 [Desulfamplus sp.]|nr:hypothetical protein [Desulfamplus sp.]